MQISYHFGRYARYRPVFKPVQNVDVSILVYVPIRYVLAGTHTVSITLISSINTDYIDSNFIWLSITANLMPLSLNYNPNSNKSSNPAPPYNNPTNSDSPQPQWCCCSTTTTTIPDPAYSMSKPRLSS